MSRRPAYRYRARARAAALLIAGVLGAGTLAGCGTGSDGGRTGGADGASHPGASEAPRLTVGEAFIPEPVTTGMAAGFFTVKNAGGADTLTSVTSDLAAKVTLHSTSGGTMRERASFPVPAHGTLTFGRGGNHVMFEQLTRKPKVGATVHLTLHFKRSGTVDVTVPVKPATYNPAAYHTGTDRPVTGDAADDSSAAHRTALHHAAIHHPGSSSSPAPS